MGVVTGVVLSFEIGANWSNFSRRTGNVVGPLLMYEVLTAFFLEGAFIGILLFGENAGGPLPGPIGLSSLWLARLPALQAIKE